MKSASAVAWLVLMTGYSGSTVAQGVKSDLLEQCTEAVKAMEGTVDPIAIDFAKASRCLGLVDGFAGAAGYYESKPGAPRSICFPAEGTTVGESVRIVTEYLQDYSERRYDSPTVLIFGAFLAAYPCT